MTWSLYTRQFMLGLSCIAGWFIYLLCHISFIISIEGCISCPSRKLPYSIYTDYIWQDQNQRNLNFLVCSLVMPSLFICFFCLKLHIAAMFPLKCLDIMLRFIHFRWSVNWLWNMLNKFDLTAALRISLFFAWCPIILYPLHYIGWCSPDFTSAWCVGMWMHTSTAVQR